MTRICLMVLIAFTGFSCKERRSNSDVKNIRVDDELRFEKIELFSAPDENNVGHVFFKCVLSSDENSVCEAFGELKSLKEGVTYQKKIPIRVYEQSLPEDKRSKILEALHETKNVTWRYPEGTTNGSLSEEDVLLAFAPFDWPVGSATESEHSFEAYEKLFKSAKPAQRQEIADFSKWHCKQFGKFIDRDLRSSSSVRYDAEEDGYTFDISPKVRNSVVRIDFLEGSRPGSNGFLRDTTFGGTYGRDEVKPFKGGDGEYCSTTCPNGFSCTGVIYSRHCAKKIKTGKIVWYSRQYGSRRVNGKTKFLVFAVGYTLCVKSHFDF